MFTIERLREMYPTAAAAADEHGDGQFHYGGPSSYEPIVRALGEILVDVTDDDYQGDSRYLLKDGDRYGLVTVGWGSCSGCDALQGCVNFADVLALANEIEAAVKWFAGKAIALEYVNQHDWMGDYDYRAAEKLKYVTQLKKVLAS
jgi:hypothetical protein